MGKNNDGGQALSSVDVAYLLAQLEAEYYGVFVVELKLLPTRTPARARLTVTVANFVGSYRTSRNTRASATGTWPSSGHKTLAGCVIRLAHEVTEGLDALRAAPMGNRTPLEAAIAHSVNADNPQD